MEKLKKLMTHLEILHKHLYVGLNYQKTFEILL